MSATLPPLLPPDTCPNADPVAVATPVLLRSALEGPPINNPSAAAGAIIDPNTGLAQDNEIIVVAKSDGAAGNSISVAVSNVANAIVTSVQISGTQITIVPASRARMAVTSALDNRFNGNYREAGNFPGTTHPMWIKINGGINPPRLYFPNPDNVPTGQWVFDLSDGVPIYVSNLVTYNIAVQPEVLSFKDYITDVASALDVAPLVSDAGQAVNAIDLSPSVLALISAIPAATGFGSLATVAAVPLVGGADAQQGTKASGIGQLCRVGPYVVVAPRTQSYDWFIAETIDSWRRLM